MAELLGIIGVGNVGYYYACNLLKAKRSLTVFDRDSEKLSILQSQGATRAASTSELASLSNTIILALPSPAAVQDVMSGQGGILASAQSGALIIDLSTIDPDTAQAFHADAVHAGISYLEAPMSGGELGGAGQAGAKAGTVTFMVGGDREAFERARPVFDVLGSHALFLGPAGTGSKVKLLSNLIAGVNMAVIAEAFVLGAANGISHETLLEVFKHTDAKSFTMMEEFADRICSNDYEGGFPVDLMHKDHRLAGEMGRKGGIPMLFNQLAQEFYQLARAQGYGRSSHAAVVEMLASLADVKLFNNERQQADRK